MPAANEYLSKMELEEKIQNFTPAEQFLARQQFHLFAEVAEIKKNCIVCNPKTGQSIFNGTSVTALLVAIAGGILNWLRSG